MASSAHGKKHDLGILESPTATLKVFINLGAAIMNQYDGGSSEAFERRWIVHFQVTPNVCSEIWHRLDLSIGDPDDLLKKNAEPKHLLWALLLHATYQTEAVLSSKIQNGEGGHAIHEETFQKWAWYFIEKMSYLEFKIVSFAFGVNCCICY